MDQLFAYESEDDVGEPSTSPAHSVEREKEPVRFERPPRERAKTRSSRWATSSAFLSPVAYDKGDVSDSEGDDDENGREDNGRPVRAVRQPEGGDRPHVSRLKKLLPPPLHETHDRQHGTLATGVASVQNKTGGHHASVVDGAASDGATGGNTTSTERPSVVKAAIKTINAAPTIGAPVSAKGAVAFNAANYAPNNDPNLAPLPAGAVIKEISAGDLRGLSGSSLASSEDLELKFRANAVRAGTVPKLAKRKNQLSALLSEAKSSATEHREKRADGASLRSATRMKYGWG